MEARTVLKLQLKDGSQAPELKGKEFVGLFFFLSVWLIWAVAQI